MPDIIIKNAQGEEVIFRGVEYVEFLEAPPEEQNTTGGTSNELA